MSRDRKELFAGSPEECAQFIAEHANGRLMEAVTNDLPGPPVCVYWKQKAPGADKARKPVDFETRETFRVKGMDSRPLIVTLDPQSDTITFRPKGTRQAVTVPIASVYHSARFTAARAIAQQKRAERKAKKGAR